MSIADLMENIEGSRELARKFPSPYREACLAAVDTIEFIGKDSLQNTERIEELDGDNANGESALAGKQFFDTASDDAMADEIATATAMYPSAPSTAQQAAYREDGREQLRLRELLAVK